MTKEQEKDIKEPTAPAAKHGPKAEAPKHTPPPAKPRQTKEIRVTVDMDPDDVVRLSNEGNRLIFSDIVGEFLQLEHEKVQELKKDDRERYMLAYGTWKYNLDNQDPVPSDLKISPRFASARARLEVDGGNPNMHYVWKRPDELRKAGYEGYTIARGGNLRTFGGGPESNIHRLGVLGDDELILMQEPKAHAEERLKKNSQKSKTRIENFDQAAAEELRRGGLPYEGNKTGGEKWTPTK